jgi:glycosidase
MDQAVHGTAPASIVRRVWEENRAANPKNAIRMRFSDNHDERRAIARFGEKGALAAQALMFTIDGVPLVFNGMEVGDTTESGAPALFEKMPILWGIQERRQEFPRFYKQMIALRKSSMALRRGDVAWLRNSDEDRVLTFVRKAGTDELLVAINMTNAPFFGSVEAAGDYEEITPKYGDPKSQAVALPTLHLEGFQSRIFRKK